jgi:hypothetical protein
MSRIAILLVVALAAGGAVFGFGHRNAEAAEARLAAIAGGIARRDVKVHCQGALGSALDVTAEAGTVEFDASGRPSDTTDLKRGVCKALRHFERDLADGRFACVLRNVRCSQDVLRSIWAVHTLTHEAWHLAGEKGEAVTECYALQTTAWAAVRLGAAPVEAQAIARYVDVHMYPELPAEYRTPACGNGGPLDLRPTSPVWP